MFDVNQLFNISFGAVPGTESTFIPVDPSLVGLDFFVQALVQDRDMRVGAFSNRLDFVVY